MSLLSEEEHRFSLLVILVLISIAGTHTEISHSLCNETTAEYYNSCPTWFVPKVKNDTDKVTVACECGPIDFYVQYNQLTNRTYIHKVRCMTFDTVSNITYNGYCPYNTHVPEYRKQVHDIVLLPNTTTELNNFMCGGLNRTGLLCSQCKDGLGPAVLSYTRECVECLDSRYGWLLYVVLTVLPTTLLCVLIIILKFDATSPSMNFLIFSCQKLVNMVNNHPDLYFVYVKDSNWYGVTLVIPTFYGVWSLDFFRYLIPPFCISSQMNTLQVMALDYTVAVYPLLLTAVVYYCIEFHDRGNRLLMWMWRPFQKCFSCIRKTWDLKGSVVNAFATFLLLSISKLVIVSCNLLYSVVPQSICGGTLSPKKRVYFDVTKPYFGHEHLYYAIPALTAVFIFVALPTFFLLFYQSRYLHNWFSCLRLRLTLIHEVIRLCQKCYKDGIDGTKDYRWFAGAYMLFRVYFLSVIGSSNDRLFDILGSLVAALVFTLIHPYKNKWFNKLDSAFFSVIAIIQIWVLYSQTILPLPFWPVAVALSIPFIYFILICGYKILTQRWIKQVIQWEFHRVKNILSIRKHDIMDEEDISSQRSEIKPLIPKVADI